MRLGQIALTALHLSYRTVGSTTAWPQGTSSISTGDLIFVRPPYDLASALDDAILASGEATVQWLRTHGTPGATREVASHVALARRNNATGALSFVQALPPAVVETPEADFWHMVGPGTVLYLASPMDSAVRGAGAAAAAARRLRRLHKQLQRARGGPRRCQ